MSRITIKLIVFLVIYSTVFAPIVSAEEKPCSTVWISGYAPVHIDGDLSDWKEIKKKLLIHIC